jgi:oligopeptidase B
LEGLEEFRDFIVLSERKNGLVELRIRSVKNNAEQYLNFSEPAYNVSIGENPEYNSDILRFSYTSLTTPISIYDCNMGTMERKLMKQYEVLGGYNAEDYVTERLYVTATDGMKIPVSLVYKKGLIRDGHSS